MACEECEENPGDETEVVYIDGSSISLELCDDCRELFREGGFVEAVSVV